MKRTFVALFAMLLAEAAFSESLPREWYQMPEDAYGSDDALTEHALEGRTDNFEKILETHGTVLDRVSAREVDKEKEWTFRAFMFDLGISASGSIGVVVAKGEAAASIYWRQKNVETSDAEESLQEGVDAVLTADSNIDRQIEAIVDAVMATGKVENRDRVRQGLRDRIFHAREMMEVMAAVPQTSWWVSRLRLDLSIDISGRVQPTVTLGGGVRLRFEWFPSRTRVQPVSVANMNPRQKELRRFLLTLVSDIRSVEDYTHEYAEFYLKSIKFGLGINLSGKLGVVKLKGAVMGHIYLSPSSLESTIAPEVVAAREGLELYSTIPVIDDEPDVAQFAYAAEHGIELRENGDGIIYDLVRDKFRQGMKQAARIGDFFVTRAERRSSEKWEVYQVKNEFSLSLSASAGVVKIGGKGLMQFAYKRK